MNLIEIIRNEIEARGIKTQRTSNGFTCSSPFRPDRNPSFSVFIGKNGGVLGYDFALGQTYTARQMLREFGWSEEEIRRAMGESWTPGARPMKKQARAPELPKPINFATPPSPTAESEEQVAEEYARCVENIEARRNTGYLKSRKIRPDIAIRVGLGVNDQGEIVIPTFDENLETLVNLQIRTTPEGEKAGKPRYRYFVSGVGGGWYHGGPKPEDAAFVLLVEGPINAAIASAALPKACVIGFPGASTSLSEGLAKRIARADKPTFITSDLDDAGVSFREKLVAQLLAVGMDENKLYILTDDKLRRDINEIFEDIGGDREALGENLVKRMVQKGKVTRRARVIRYAAAILRQNRMAGTVRDFEVLLGSQGPAVRVGRIASYESRQAVENFAVWLAKRAKVSFTDALKALSIAKIGAREILAIVKTINEVPLTKNDRNALWVLKERKGVPFVLHPRYGVWQVDAEEVIRYFKNLLGEVADFFAELIRRAKERVDRDRREFYRRMAGSRKLRWAVPKAYLATAGP